MKRKKKPDAEEAQVCSEAVENILEISIDCTLVNHGNLLNSFTPSVNPAADIDDPNHAIPANWNEREVWDM